MAKLARGRGNYRVPATVGNLAQRSPTFFLFGSFVWRSNVCAHSGLPGILETKGIVESHLMLETWCLLVRSRLGAPGGQMSVYIAGGQTVFVQVIPRSPHA